MSWIINIGVKILFKYLLTPKNFRRAMAALARILKDLAAKTEYTDVDDKAVDVFIEAFNLEEEMK
jgi:hypothetical protein